MLELWDNISKERGKSVVIEAFIPIWLGNCYFTYGISLDLFRQVICGVRQENTMKQ